MTKDDLILKAEALRQPSDLSAKEFNEKGQFLAAEMNRLMLTRTDLDNLIGQGNITMMEDNHRNHARFMSSVFICFQPDVLVETVLWVYRAYRAHGFHLTYWPAQLDQWVELLKVQLSPETFQEIYPFYHWMIIHQSAFVNESDKMRG
jgi:hypothetical protein